MKGPTFSLYTSLLLEAAAGITTDTVPMSREDLVSPSAPLRGSGERWGRVPGTTGAAPHRALCCLRSHSVCALLHPPAYPSCDSCFILARPLWFQHRARPVKDSRQTPVVCEWGHESQESLVASMLLCSSAPPEVSWG